MGTHKGVPSPRRGKGLHLAWVLAHTDHAEDECLIWPFSRNMMGYGQLGLNGKVVRAHRIMCEFVQGPPPSQRHHAAHSCGNGKIGCVNPKHLSWKTPRENRLDANEHGTGSGRKKPRRLTIELIDEIKAAEGTYVELADKYGVYFGTIGKIKRGEFWIRPRSNLTREQILGVKLLAGTMTAKDAARATGIKTHTIYNIWSGKNFAAIT